MKDVGSKSFDNEIAAAKVSVVDFWAPWCIPCKRLEEVMKQALLGLGGVYDGKISFLKVNVDNEPGLAQKYGVMSLPTVVGFFGPDPAERFTGRTKEEFVSWLQRLSDRAGF